MHLRDIRHDAFDDFVLERLEDDRLIRHGEHGHARPFLPAQARNCKPKAGRSGGGGGVEGVSKRVANGCKQRGSVAEPRRGGGEVIGGAWKRRGAQRSGGKGSGEARIRACAHNAHMCTCTHEYEHALARTRRYAQMLMRNLMLTHADM